MSLPELRLTLPPTANKHVLALQRALGAHGFTIEADATFGFQTQKAVMRFQSEHDLRPTGVVDQETWEALGL